MMKQKIASKDLVNFLEKDFIKNLKKLGDIKNKDYLFKYEKLGDSNYFKNSSLCDEICKDFNIGGMIEIINKYEWYFKIIKLPNWSTKVIINNGEEICYEGKSLCDTLWLIMRKRYLENDVFQKKLFDIKKMK